VRKENMGEVTEIIAETDETEEVVEPQENGEEENPEVEENDTTDDSETEEDEDVVTIGDEKEEEPADMAPTWVRELRKKHRQIKQRNRELENQLQQYQQTPAVQAPGAKPTLESCDYDSDQYEAKLAQWFEAKNKHKEAQAKIRADEEQQLEAYRERIAKYQEKKKTLKVRDFEDAESAVEEALSIAQQNIIIEGASNPALLVYALGKNPEKARKLAEIKNYVRFAFEVAKLEKELKVSKRKPKTKPEKTIEGTGSLSGTSDRTLDRLRDEALKKGDITKNLEYRRKKKKAAAG
jgi:hypothetical protein